MITKLHNTLLLAVAAVLPTYLWRFTIGGIPTNPLEILIVLALLAGVCDQTTRRRWRHATTQLPWTISMSVLLFVLAAIISTIISPHLATSLGILKGWVILPIVYGWMVLGYVGAQKESEKSDAILNALLASAVVVSLIGITQIGTLDRIRSVYDVPNSLALFITPILVATIWRAWTERSALLGTAAMTLFIALLETQSVGAFLSLVVAVSIGVFKFRHALSAYVRRSLVIGLIGMAVIGGVLLQDKITYLTSPHSSAAVRLQLWSISWDIVAEHPLLGVGLGVFEPVYQQKLHERFAQYEQGMRSDKPLPEFVFRDPHNVFFSFLLNAGLLGLVSIATLLFYILYWRASPLSSTWLALAALLIFGLVDTVYWKNDLSILFWVLCSLTYKLGSRSPEAN